MTEAEYRRLQRLPAALDNTRRKLLALEREAHRHRLYELLDDQEWLLHRIRRFKADLPGWWFSVCECQVSCDASCAPTSESEHIAFAESGNEFDAGFHVDLPQPSTLAQALHAVSQRAMEEIMARQGL